MANPRVSSPRIPAPENSHAYGPHRFSSRTSSYSSPNASQPFPTPAAPVSIPNSWENPAPPPLPPPRFIEDIAMGRDPGWQWGNSGGRGEFANKFGAVSPGSSISQGSWNLRKESEMGSDDSGEARRDSSTSTIRSPSRTDFDEGYHSLSGTSIAYQSVYFFSYHFRDLIRPEKLWDLHGERPLEKQNRTDSSHAYDKQLLTKFAGKPRTPPRSSTLGSVDMSPIPHGLYRSSTKPPQPPPSSLSFSDRSFSSSSDSPFKVGSPFGRKWTSSPKSAVVSPSLISNAANAKSFKEYRNPPILEGVQSPSSVPDGERFARVRIPSRRADSNGSIITGGFEDGGASGSKRSQSYDPGFLTNEPDLDLDFPIEETGGMRQLHLDDRSPPSIDVHSPNSRLGMKRRASSPPRDATHDSKTPLQTVGGTSSELYQRRTSGHLSATRASPVHRYHPSHGSVSPASSGGLLNGSYASSAALSLGGSSITSLSSHERSSPSGLSPLSEQHDSRDSHYVKSPSLNSVPQDPMSHPHHMNSDIQTTAALAQKMSAENASHNVQSNAPKLQANIHICNCCPKKPKKFDTMEELRQHQNEKQYVCQYCHNRFKNKNEAERHQNSLHLRRHSWSCATLDRDYQAAFHPCNAIPPNTNANHAPAQQPGMPAEFDVCGYCGEQFPNFPTQDWVARSNHLTATHKFGECNQSKKFFRADHFRQHLKHSHAGTSGKWTNMLENSCMKDEPPLTPEAQSQEQFRQQQQHEQLMQGAPVANMMGGGTGMRQGMYGVMGISMHSGNEMQHTKIEEEMPQDM
ncbi:hypothetical protein MMC18_005099 [Xylographa bjoerkii]|nr:hypothetical protein [Xylographa bjoerkii]